MRNNGTDAGRELGGTSAGAVSSNPPRSQQRLPAQCRLINKKDMDSTYVRVFLTTDSLA
jgi:hypothetical protein